MKLRSLLLLPLLPVVVGPKAALGDDVEDRLRMALQIARERNDRALVRQVEAVDQQRRAGAAVDAIETAVRKVENAGGIDPGGWAMVGQPLYRPGPRLAEASAEAGRQLRDAIAGGDPKAVRAVILEWMRLLGDQAGVPDGRRRGVRPGPLSLDKAEATRLFLAALETAGSTLRRLSEGRPLTHQMLRLAGSSRPIPTGALSSTLAVAAWRC